MFDIILFGARVLFVLLLVMLLIAIMRTGVGIVSGQRESDREWNLFVEKGPKSIQGLNVPVRGPIIVGRAPGSDIMVDDSCVSSRHARFAVHEDILTVEDLNSTNGTYVNKHEIYDPFRLEDGDRVTFGDTTIRVRHA